jgi:hypothetical protein
MIAYICLIIWLGLSVYGLISGYKNKKKDYAFEEAIGVSIASFFISFGVISLLFAFSLKIKPLDIIKTETFQTEIVSIRTHDSISGFFFIGCGSIGESQYYIYMKKLEDGSYKQSMLPVEKCRIYENSNLETRVEWDIVTRVLPVWMRFGIDSLDNITKQEGDYRIIVPENTIIQSFEIN